MTETVIQEQGVQEARTYTHRMRCRRSFKRPKITPYGPKCAAKAAQRAAASQEIT